MKRRIEIWLLGAAAVMLTGCKDYDEEVVISSEPVTVELAYTFSSAAGTQTRQSDDVVVPNTSSPRLPQNLTVIQMKGNEPQNSYVSWNEPVEKPNDPARKTSLYYHSSFCDMKQGVNGCLVYGSVDDASTSSDKANKGSLEKPLFVSLNTQNDLQNLSFNLESIYKSTDYPTTNGVPVDATTLAGHLNTIANVTGWQSSTNPILKNLFENFTGHGSDIPGSAASVQKWLEAVQTAAQSYYDNPPSSVGDNEKAILTNIVSAVNGISVTVDENSYPRGLFLPDGAAALRWTGSVFEPAMQTTTLDNINSVSRFAYPASLYYFVDSKIRTSNSTVNYATEYGGVTSEVTKTAWDDILDRNFTDGTQVKATTKSVALEDPVQYAVAQLKVTVKAAGASLKDNAETDITIDETTFPLTGVIICGQRPVNYRFEQASNSDVDVKFIYDSQVKTNNSGYYLTASEPTGGPSTLVLQSYEGEDVDIILEFENKGTQTFKCIDGFVYPDTRFYLIGKITAPTKDVNDEKTNQVFTKDYITTVNMTVSSLAKAYNVLPNLLTSNLEIGVETTPKWVAATPTTVVME